MSYPIFREDFEGGATIPATLVDVAGGVYGINTTSANAFTGSNSVTITGSGNHLLRSANPDSAGGNINLSVYFRTVSNTAWTASLLGRGTTGDLLAFSGYRADFTSGGVTIYKGVGGSYTNLSGATGVSGATVTPGAAYLLELRLNGTSLSARVVRQSDGFFWANSGATGTFQSAPASTTATDATYSGSGTFDLFQSVPPNAVFMDDLIYGPAVPAIDNPTFTITGLGGTQQLTAGGFTDPLNGVTWSSSNTSVATVNSAGLVTAVAAGTSTITATGKRDTGQTATATATINLPSATAYTLTAPSPASGYVNNVSGNFTATPNGAYTGTLTFALSGGGLSGTKTLTFSNSAAAQTFNITPLTPGTVTVTPTSSPALTDPAAVTYTVSAQGLSVSPTTFIESVAVTTTLTGTGTLWSTTAPTITVTGAGAAGTVLGSVTVASNTSATLLVTPGTTAGSLIFHDSTTTATTTASVTPPPTLWHYLGSVVGFAAGLVGSVGYTVLRSDGSTYTARTTSGVFAVGSAGYAALVSLPTSGSFAILWDDGSSHFTFEVVNQFGVEPPSAAVPGGLNQSQCLAEILATVAGLASGFVSTGNSSPSFLAPDGATVRVQGTVDQLGNRTVTGYNPPI